MRSSLIERNSFNAETQRHRGAGTQREQRQEIMIVKHAFRYASFSVPLRLCASAFILLAGSTAQAAEPSTWKLWPFRSVQKAAPASAPVQVAPASFQAPLPGPSQPTDPFPLPNGAPGVYELYRQTNDDVLRKSWGCVNCHQGVVDMHD